MDPAWLSNRKYNGPTAEDMSLLDIPDPLVSLRLSHCNAHLHLRGPGATAISATSARGALQMHGPAVNQSTQESVRTERTTGAGAGVKAAVQEYAYNAEFGLRHSTDPKTLVMKYQVDVNMDQVFGRFNPQAAARLLQPVRDEWSQDSLLDLISSPSTY